MCLLLVVALSFSLSLSLSLSLLTSLPPPRERPTTSQQEHSLHTSPPSAKALVTRRLYTFDCVRWQSHDRSFSCVALWVFSLAASNSLHAYAPKCHNTSRAQYDTTNKSPQGTSAIATVSLQVSARETQSQTHQCVGLKTPLARAVAWRRVSVHPLDPEPQRYAQHGIPSAAEKRRARSWNETWGSYSTK